MDLLVGHAIKGVNKSYIAKLRRRILLAATQKIADEIDNPKEPMDDENIVQAKHVALLSSITGGDYRRASFLGLPDLRCPRSWIRSPIAQRRDPARRRGAGGRCRDEEATFNFRATAQVFLLICSVKAPGGCLRAAVSTGHKVMLEARRPRNPGSVP
jgi:hypothetical protein